MFSNFHGLCVSTASPLPLLLLPLALALVLAVGAALVHSGVELLPVLAVGGGLAFAVQLAKEPVGLAEGTGCLPWERDVFLTIQQLHGQYTGTIGACMKFNAVETG